MKRAAALVPLISSAGLILAFASLGSAANSPAPGFKSAAFPMPLSDYPPAASNAIVDTLWSRVQVEPINAVVTLIFVLAIVHTFFATRFQQWAHRVEEAHARKTNHRRGTFALAAKPLGEREEVSFAGQMLHFLGEIEAIFGIWAIVLMIVLTVTKGWPTTVDYFSHRVSFTEPMFVVVIMALASTRPVIRVAEQGLRAVARLGRGSVGAWWYTLLIVTPLLGSLITEPAAMTIAALLLARQFFVFKPSPRFAYATMGLLFVNVSVGGTLTHFAAPPVLMVAGPWHWNTVTMLTHFGWRAILGIVVATTLYGVIFRKEFRILNETKRHEAVKSETVGEGGASDEPVPLWVTIVQLGFIGWTVAVAHYPPLFVGGFLVYLAFAQATAHHQNDLDFRPPLLVGFFLAGLVVHGGLQGWWIEPVLKSLSEVPLFIGATTLTAFNDNAAITYLATLVPDFTDALKYAVVAGAVSGGGLTVIANAPNPAGQSLLQRFFPGGISPLSLFLAAFGPTLLVAACFMAI